MIFIERLLQKDVPRESDIKQIKSVISVTISIQLVGHNYKFCCVNILWGATKKFKNLIGLFPE